MVQPDHIGVGDEAGTTPDKEPKKEVVASRPAPQKRAQTATATKKKTTPPAARPRSQSHTKNGTIPAVKKNIQQSGDSRVKSEVASQMSPHAADVSTQRNVMPKK